MASKEDPETQMIERYIIDGWPAKYETVPTVIQVYWKYRHELSTHNGLVLRNDRILIPCSLRKQIIEKFHKSHSGIEATTKLARDTVFWPGLTDQIRQRIQHCNICTQFSANPQAQPMQTHQIPLYPFQKISMDIFECELKGQKFVYLITVDHYSDYFEIDELRTQSAATVVKICKRNFATHGKPQEISTDGGPQFMSEDFNAFAKQWSFKHSVSAPYHQQANGKAESAVKIAKLLLKKANESKQDFWELLLQWRNTPNKIGSSPAQRLFNRRTRCGLPMAEKKYAPKIEENVPEKIYRNRQQTKLHYDRKTRALPDLEMGQPVYVKLNPGNKQWARGTVTNPVTDRSTVVSIGDREYRRDNMMIKPANLEAPVYAESIPSNAEATSPGRIRQQPMQTSNVVPEVSRPKRVTHAPVKFNDYDLY
ncbi:uncharacterized protein K02A2.6-like [Malaya genurostris]|uniref:uncharacterized protein K02A2.6-like n=1 Tax=Malaya genurostris TaxID=325434 RepID=UPI0026F3E11C|nr:uncharacterized protein K02A2.6-like [Malaya genurostris]